MDNFFAAAGVFNAVGSGQEDKEESCMEHNPFFDWYTCTCSFDKCLEMQDKKQHNGAGNKRVNSGAALMASVLTTWAVKKLICN